MRYFFTCKIINTDVNKTISTNYDVLAGEYFYDENDQLQAEGEMVAYRGLFLIDKEGVVTYTNDYLQDGFENDLIEKLQLN